MQTVYYISGLGADERIFCNLSIPGANMIYIPWQPHEESDNMESYARKLAAFVKTPGAIVIGLSFGGMLAVEMAKHIPVKKVIIISSSKTSAELPEILLQNKWLIQRNLLPSFVYKIQTPLAHYYLGSATEDERRLINIMLQNISGSFIGWALSAMATWDNKTYNDNITHIHGTADHLITPRNIHAQYWIEGGSHIMIYNRAKEISAIIEKELLS